MAKYFSADEVKGLDQALVDKLDLMREIAGIPILITCGLRTEAQNCAVGGVNDSAHEKGLAADLHCPDSHTRYLLLKGAFGAGFHRIEDATAHVHVDIDGSKPQDVVFQGVSK